MIPRGEIINRTYAEQVRNFTGMVWGTISPTDIDAFIEYRNKLFIFIEIKYVGTELLHGQTLALERLVDVVGVHKKALLVIGEHTANNGDDIIVSECMVTMLRIDREWKRIAKPYKVKQACDWFIRKHIGMI